MLRSSVALRRWPSDTARPQSVRNWEIHPVPANLPPAPPAAACPPPPAPECPPPSPAPATNLGARPKEPKCPPKPKKCPAPPATPPRHPRLTSTQIDDLVFQECDAGRYHPSTLTPDELRRIPIANGGLLQPRTQEKKKLLASTIRVARSLAKKRTCQKKEGETTPDMVRRLSRKAVNTIVYGMVSSDSEEE